MPPEILIKEVKLFLHKNEITAITNNIIQVIIKIFMQLQYFIMWNGLNKILIASKDF